MDTLNIDIDRGRPKDAEAISALAIQVFLDTYATDGVRPDLAAEALSEYSQDKFHRRLSEPNRMFLLAKRGDGIIGFAEFTVSPVQLLGQEGKGAELIRIYVQPRSQRLGIGRKLLMNVERVLIARVDLLWLTVWAKNKRALEFYKVNGYHSTGILHYELQGKVYENTILAKVLKPLKSVSDVPTEPWE